MNDQVKAAVAQIEFHQVLNPKIWVGEQLSLQVRVQLLRTAIAFIKFLELPGLRVEDIIITGSNASYNYAADSDIDLHLVVDPGRTECPELADEFFNAKRLLWNSEHDISVHGIRVELYVESINDASTSNGVYSVLRGDWVTKPSRRRPSWNDKAVERKVAHLADLIDDLLSQDADAKKVFGLLSRISSMRRSGLSAGGLYSVENLTYKALRSMGYLQKLYDFAVKAHDEDLSI